MFQVSRVFICERQNWVHMIPAADDTFLELNVLMSEATVHSDVTRNQLCLPPAVLTLKPALAEVGDQTNDHQTPPVSTLASMAPLFIVARLW